MNMVWTRSACRTLMAGVLAFSATLTGFGLTASPAQAQTRTYNATLAAPLAAPTKKVVNGVVWNCSGDQCHGAVDGSAPVNACRRVVKSFGAVTRFAMPDGDLAADKLARCNG